MNTDTESILISDANIFFDLISINLIDQFFAVPKKLSTTDLIIAEIKDEKGKEIIETLIRNEKLIVKEFTQEEMQEIKKLNGANRQLSVQDCSVWYYAKKEKGILLTGDKRLRLEVDKDNKNNKDSKDNIDVHGIFFVFELILKYQLISATEAISAVKELSKINTRLPQDKIKDFIENIKRSR